MKITKIKFLIMSCAALFALAITAPKAKAQTPTYYPNSITLVNVTGGTSTNLTNCVMDVRKQQEVALTWRVNGSTNATLRIAASVDGSIYDTNHWVLTSAGAGSVTATNLTVAGFGYLRLDVAESAGTITATNNFKWGTKISSP